MPVKFIVEMVKGLFGVSGQRDPEQSELSQTNITVEREPDSEDDSATAEESDGESDGEWDEPDTEADESESEEETADASDSDGQPSGDPVGDISGIGPTYSERLAEIGVETVDDLAAEGAAEIAEAAEVSESRATDWISQAKDW